ncbi:ABC transporter permease [Arthrobacter sp. 35W]|uniref:ABC transporter permease n=1 Tax=Arthrobacter sp. 35W TaxID=1132441 RepID=UPI0003FD37F8|nr:ABC transporter permease [Arthrobacter sp. 35W]
MEGTTLLNTGPAAWVVLAVLLGGAAAVWALALHRRFTEVLLAGARALIQLAVVAVVIAAVSPYPGLAMAFVALMFIVAVWTSGHRVAPRGRWWMAALPIAAGTLPAAGALLLSGVLPLQALALIAVLGQQIGGAMATTTLAGRRVADELVLRRGEVEAAAALGFEWPSARRLVSRHVAGEAVLPGLDQTRTAGLVTLPGAFVGMILGGASPIDAGIIQLLVLVSLLAVNTTAAWAAFQLAAHGLWEKPARRR